MMSKKAQAATEYLSTYGWAVLILALVLAALWAMGVFDIKAPEMCRFDIGTFECANYKIISNFNFGNTPQTLPISLKNTFGKRIYLCAFMCSKEAPDPTKGYPTTSGGNYENRFENACGCSPPTTSCGPRFEPGQTRILVPDPAFITGVIDNAINRIDWFCRDANGLRGDEGGESVTVGQAYSTKLYIAYSFEGETQGAPRITVGDMSTTVQKLG